jgi:catechol 2,3-dioxygenase-like lactoylglutathione lyase family enzyme
MTQKKSKLLRMDNVGIMVEDMDAVVAFFQEIGFELEGTTTVEGEWVDRTIGIDNAKCDIAMLRTPDGKSRLELSRFRNPKGIPSDPAPVNALGIRRLMFAVEDIHETLARLETNHGAKLIGEVVNYEDTYLLCYVRGPEGLMMALAQEIGAEHDL